MLRTSTVWRKWTALYTTKSREEVLELNASSHRDESGEGLGPYRRLQPWAPGAVMLSLFQEKNKHDYWRMVQMITDFIRASARVRCSQCSPFVT
jgi:hypothetical protein